MLRSTTASILYWYLLSLAVVLYALTLDAGAWWLVAVLAYFVTGCLGVTITFHRYLAHKSFVMPKWMERLFSVFGTLGGTGSSVGWVAVHRQHHRYADRADDPHRPALGWRLFAAQYDFKFNKFGVRDLIADRFHRGLHEHYNLILAAWAVLLALLHPWLAIFGFFVPLVIQVTVSNLSNFFNHVEAPWLGSYRTFGTREHSVNNVLIAVLAWGEGWHNNHHARPRRWHFGEKWWEFDPSGAVIRVIRKFT